MTLATWCGSKDLSPLDVVMPQQRKPAPDQDDPQIDADGQIDADALARQKVLGDRLKGLFDDVAQEPIPAEFMDLLNKLSDQNPGDEPE
ncbi:MAG: hypothetical protein KJS97_07665 [Alphaproteobacteria bacterium]|nr:hypothetical protein [Alphaproteobacteria bacterium]